MTKESYVSIPNVHQSILSMIGSDLFQKNIGCCAYDNESDFRNGAIFGAAQAALFITSYAQHHIVESYTAAEQAEYIQRVVESVKHYCESQQCCDTCEIKSAIYCDGCSPRPSDWNTSAVGNEEMESYRKWKATQSKETGVKWQDRLLSLSEVEALCQAARNHKNPDISGPVRAIEETFEDFMKKGAEALIKEDPELVASLL